MKLQDLIQRVQSLYSKGAQSDDSRLSSRHIYNKLLTVRSRLISQEAKKKQRISQWNYQVLPCVELELVPSHDCPCVPPIGCQILRTKYKLPEPLSGLSGTLIQAVTTIDRGIKIDEVTLNAVNAQRGNKYTSKKMNYFLHNGYLYVTTSQNLKAISITALFEDPIEASKYKGLCDCKDCANCVDYLEEDFPIDNDMIDALIELTINEVVILFSQSQEDQTNNSRDSLREQSK